MTARHPAEGLIKKKTGAERLDRVRYRHERHLQLTRAMERLVLREWTRVGSCFPQDRSCGAEAGFAEATCRPDV